MTVDTPRTPARASADRDLVTPVDLALAASQGRELFELAPGPGVLLSSGDRVGAWTVGHRMGVGGMSEVWLVRHQLSGEERALKVLLNPSPAQVRRLLSECLAHLELAHPNILPILGCVRHQGQASLLMPVVHGPSLRQFLDQGADLTQEAALGLLRAVMRAVAHAHEQRVVHRDLKPDNIMLDLRGPQVVPLVTDFGIARRLDSLAMTRAGAMLGTPTHCAPEQLHDASSADQRADVYSLGVLLVQLLTGHLPFRGETLRELAEAHEQGPDLIGLPEEICPLARDLLAPDPRNRLPSVAAMAAALDALGLTGECPASAPLRTLPLGWAGRRPTRPSAAMAPPGAPTLTDEVPLPKSLLVGRLGSLDELRRLLAGEHSDASCRLVTVSGPGGIGKSRLVLELAHELVSEEHQVLWVDLADRGPDEDLVGYLLRSLRPLASVPEEASARREGLLRLLRGTGPCTLVLDTADHHAPALVSLADEVLARCAETRVLLTRRAPLRIPGERVVVVRPLEEPEAIQLLRGAAALAGQILSDSPAMDARLRGLARKVGGNPLALEVLAENLEEHGISGLRRLGSADLLDLARPSQGGHPRHESLDASIGWSWTRLSPDDQQLLARCSVFAGEFTLSAAAEVLGQPDPLRLRCRIGALADHCLLTRRFGPRGELRLGFYPVGRVHAARQLEALGDRELLERRHAACYARLEPPRARAPLRGGRASNEASQADLQDLLLAARRAVALGQPQAGAQALLTAWAVGGVQRDGSELLSLTEHLLAQPQPAHLAARLRALRLSLQELGGAHTRICTGIQELLDDLADLELFDTAAEVLQVRARHHAFCGGRVDRAAEDVDAATLLSAGPGPLVARAQLLLLDGHTEEAEEAVLGALRAAARPGVEGTRTAALLLHSEILLELLAVEEAATAAARGRDLAENLGDPVLHGRALTQEASCLLAMGRARMAIGAIEAAIALFDQASATVDTDRARLLLVRCLAREDNLVAAVALAGLLVKQLRERGEVVQYMRVRLVEAELRGRLGQAHEAHLAVDEVRSLLGSTDVGLLRAQHAVVEASVSALADTPGELFVRTEPQLPLTPRLRLDLALHQANALARARKFDRARRAYEDLLHTCQVHGLTGLEQQTWRDWQLCLEPTAEESEPSCPPRAR